MAISNTVAQPSHSIYFLTTGSSLGPAQAINRETRKKCADLPTIAASTKGSNAIESAICAVAMEERNRPAERAPDAIPEDASLDQLKVAKKQIGEFQSKITVFRECLQEAESNPDNSPGNKQAIVESYNYSVEMEERIAARFNEAVRDYKERKAAAEG